MSSFVTIVEVGLAAGAAILTAGIAWLLYRRDRGPVQSENVARIDLIRSSQCGQRFNIDARLERFGWDGSVRELFNMVAFRFSGLTLADLSDTSRRVRMFPAIRDDDGAQLELCGTDRSLRVTLTDANTDDIVARHWDLLRDYQSRIARESLHLFPCPVWLEDKTGQVAWTNAAYDALAKIGPEGHDTSRPLLRIADETLNRPEKDQGRCRFVPRKPLKDQWFDITQIQIDDLTLMHATNVTNVVKAEAAQRSFVQTLTKTFAQLSTGLAIFDRNRQLALFNPALLDLTGLGPEFLSSRPPILTFFDQLREYMILPEPRDYQGWRDRFLKLIAEAEDGSYQETWSLPDGCTYRVTGRPHPNGAVAFLFEDISAEVTLTRRFREQIDITQSVMEALDEAIAVFSSDGTLSYCNPAYLRLWHHNLPPAELNSGVNETTLHWQKHCEPSPIWGDFRDFVAGMEGRTDWSGTARLLSGAELGCQFRPLQGGATMAVFRDVQTDLRGEPALSLF
ncbi:PAS-domain containing protein [Pseudooceanicola sp. C21-150M6]|uniref:PAS-domain containing protein n=1 Tax=Pseudooceanicola sp. C21-150M6 TaxID=3434355 RepID=UPI003D7FAF1B